MAGNSNGNSNGHRPRRFLFTTSPFYGHLHPLVPLARALVEAGHEVAFAATPSFAPTIRAAGFEFLPAGLDEQNDPEFHRLMAQLATMPPGPESERAIIGQVFLDLGPRRLAADLVPLAGRWRPDMLIRESASVGTVIAAEHLGLPHANVSPGMWEKGESVWMEGASKYLDPIRQSWGLAPDPTLESLYPYLSICYSPPSLASIDLDKPRSLPPNTHFIRRQFYDQADGAGLPEWVRAMPDQPVVYVTLGTMVNNMPGGNYYPAVFQAIIAGLRDEPVNLIVTLGREKDPADFGPQPPNVHIERYIPQSLMFPYCDLVISHGGSNTVLQTLDAGLPMVMVPLIADQFMNAGLCRLAKFGEVVELGDLSPESIRSAARKTLDDPAYRQNVARLRDEMHAQPSIDHAVELVESVAMRRAPVGSLAAQG